MSTLKFTDEMLLAMHRYCDDNYFENVMTNVNINPSSENTWDILDYFDFGFSEAQNKDKTNFVLCFLENGGKVIINNSLFLKKDVPNLLSYLNNNGFISGEEVADISLAWTDVTYGEPYFTM